MNVGGDHRGLLKAEVLCSGTNVWGKHDVGQFSQRRMHLWLPLEDIETCAKEFACAKGTS